MANFLDLTTGLPALWAKIKSKFYTKAEVDALIPEDEVMWVNLTINHDTSTYTADKTSSEIKSAINAGKVVYGLDTVTGEIWQYDGDHFTMYIVDNELYVNNLFYDGQTEYSLSYDYQSYITVSDVDNRFNGYLSKTNTTSYTPTANYHPATKKYVDDSIGNITVPTASTTTPLMDGTAAIGSSTNYAKADHVHPSDTSKLTRHVSRSGGLEHSTISNLYNQFTVQVANDGGGLVNNFTLTPTSTTINNVVTPTSDGMAANKKYVDDVVAAAADVSPYLSGLADTNISNTQGGQALIFNDRYGKWVNMDIPNESIRSLEDTTISDPPTDGQVLQYDATSSKWVNATLPTGVTETRVNELIAAALAQYGDGDTASYGYNDASEVNY